MCGKKQFLQATALSKVWRMGDKCAGIRHMYYALNTLNFGSVNSTNKQLCSTTTYILIIVHSHGGHIVIKNTNSSSGSSALD